MTSVDDLPAATTTTDPREEYESRLAARRESLEHASVSDRRAARARGLTFLVAVALAVVAYRTGSISPWWIAPPSVAFVGLLMFHRGVINRLERARRAAYYYEASIDRLDDDWIDRGSSGDRYVSPEHIYTSDLDIFGRGSLFHLLSTARTRLGEDRLASWLASPATADQIKARQQAVDELRNHLDLREELALLEGDGFEGVDQKKLLAWAREPPRRISTWGRLLAAILAAFAVAAVTAWLLGAGLALLMGVVIVESLLVFAYRKPLRRLAATVDDADSGLAILSQVLSVIERQTFEAPMLLGLATRLNTTGLPPSRRIAALSRLIGWLNDSLRNPFFVPIAFLLVLPVHLIHAIETWRAKIGPSVPAWLAAVADFEAVSALAGYAYEHPNDPFPDIVEAGAVVEGEQLGHPLIASDECVRNDISLGGDLRLMLVSGSNMSGKSTLLRAIGTNVVLALAGAPVRARRLRVSTMQIGTAMRINDSLLDGKSQFYAAISRLKRVVDPHEGDRPLLYLLDEILQGTNSSDRRAGAEAVIRTLVERGAIGLVTTHDLALTEIVGPLGERAINVHFEDQLADGRMTFDYRLRPGVVERSNALELMRMMGLEV